MAVDWIQREVESYTVVVGGRREGHRKQKWRFAIEMFKDKEGKFPVGRAFFYDTAVPEDDALHDNVIYLYAPSSVFPSFVDILRNERPLYLRFQRSEKQATLSTEAEIVGEAEM